MGLNDRTFQDRQSQGVAGLGELKRDVIKGGSGPMFGEEGQLLASPTHIQIGVAPAVQFA